MKGVARPFTLAISATVAGLIVVAGCGSDTDGCEGAQSCSPAAGTGGRGASGGKAGSAGTAGSSSTSGGSQNPGTAGGGQAGAASGESGIGGESEKTPAGGAGSGNVGTSGAAGEDTVGGAGSGPAPVLTTVRVIDSEDGHRVQGARVIVNDASGELLATHDTNPNGIAVVDVPKGGTVTAAWVSYYHLSSGTVPKRSLTSAYQVEPGGNIELSVFDQSAPRAEPPTMSVTVTLQTDLPSMDWRRRITFPCSGAGAFTTEKTATFDETSPCKGKTTFDIWGLLSDSNGDLYSFVSDLGVPFSAGGNLTRTLTANDTDLSTTQLTFIGAPLGTDRLLYSVAASFEGQDGDPLILDKSMPSPSTEGIMSMRFPSTAFDRYVVTGRLILEEYDTAAVGLQRVAAEVGFQRVEEGLSAERDWSVDAIARFDGAPRVGGATLDRLTVGWSLTEDGRLGDDIYLYTVWPGTYWTAFAPPTRSGAITLPDLPDDLVDFLPATDDTPNTSVEHDDFAEIADYSAFLKHPPGTSDDGNRDFAVAR